MSDNQNTLNIEAWDIDTLYPDLPLLISKAAENELSLSINYHVPSREGLTGVSIIHDLLLTAEVPFELNISFEGAHGRGKADRAG